MHSICSPDYPSDVELGLDDYDERMAWLIESEPEPDQEDEVDPMEHRRQDPLNKITDAIDHLADTVGSAWPRWPLSCAEPEPDQEDK